MISVTITSDLREAAALIVSIQGEIKRPRALNDALGRRLARELQGHFRARNSEPNKLGGRKTNFWKQLADATSLAEVSDTGAVVTVAERRFNIHVFGGTIRPTGGRKALTIPMVKEAHGLPVSEYEARTGNKLFRLPGTRLLFERGALGNQSTADEQTVTTRRNGVTGRVRVRARSLIRPVYALVPLAIVKPDARALPDTAKLVSALQDEADKWAAREMARITGNGGKA